MSERRLDAKNLPYNMDWIGNNAAFTCPKCGKVFIVSAHMNKGGRDCPSCSESVGYVEGGAGSGGSAWIVERG
jgi:transcription elongation factor Elf1